MRTILTTCFLVLLLPWELNCARFLSPSTPSKHGGSAESHRSPSRSEGPTILLTSVQPTTELRPEHGVSSSKRSTHFPPKKNLAGTSHADHKTNEMQTTKEENESPSSSSSLSTSKKQTKRSVEYSTEAQEQFADEDSTILATRDHNQHSTIGILYPKQSADTSQALRTSMSHAKRKTTELQINTGKSKSPSHSSFLTTSRRLTKRSSITVENNQSISTLDKLNTTDTTTTEKNNQTKQEVKSMEKKITDNLQQTTSSSMEKVVSQQANTTTQLQITQGVITEEPVKVSVDHQIKVQTTARSSQTQESGDTKTTTSTTVVIPKTTNSSKNISEITIKAQTNDRVLPISTSTTKATFIPTTFMTSTGPSTVHSPGSSRGSSTDRTTGPTTRPGTGPATGPSTSSSTGSTTDPAKVLVTGETVTTSMTMDGKTSTAAPTASLTTQPAKRPTTKKILPVIPENHDQSNAKKTNTGPIVAALIGSALVLMFIAIAVILLRKRRMQKRQLDNPDWAGPSPFLESEIQPNPPNQADEELFQTKRDTKRISLHSFLPQRLSQRLSLLVEEEVQMNDVVNSTFGKNENPQNGKPTVQQDQEQDQNKSQDKSQEQKLTDAQTPDGVSLSPGAPEIVVMPAEPVDSGILQPPSAPGEEIPPSPSTEASTALPTPPPFEDVDLSLPQITIPSNTSPAPQT